MRRIAPTSRSMPWTPRGCGRRAGSSEARKELDAFAEDRLIAGQSAAADRTEQPLTHGDGAGRGHAGARLAHRPGAAVERHRGISRRGVERSVVGVPPHRRRQPVPLPAHLLADQRRASTGGSATIRGEGPRVRACRSSRARDIARVARAPRPTPRRPKSPAMALLDRAPLPNAFPVHAPASAFPIRPPGLDAHRRARLDRRRCNSTSTPIGAPILRRSRRRRACATRSAGKRRAQSSNTCCRETRRISRRRKKGDDSLLPRARAAAGRLHASKPMVFDACQRARQRACLDADRRILRRRTASA